MMQSFVAFNHPTICILNTLSRNGCEDSDKILTGLYQMMLRMGMLKKLLNISGIISLPQELGKTSFIIAIKRKAVQRSKRAKGNKRAKRNDL